MDSPEHEFPIIRKLDAYNGEVMAILERLSRRNLPAGKREVLDFRLSCLREKIRNAIGILQS